ncbi:NifB/NifX family molybdenum-iron cluster-binding protein [Bdellovibrionota bacterium FG-1]
MMKNGVNKHFCKQELRPLVGTLAVVVVLTLGWVTYHEVKMRKDPVYAAQYHQLIHHPANGVQTAAGAPVAVGAPVAGPVAGMVVAAAAGGGIPPIKLSDVVTHPNYGQNCTQCHQVIGPKSRAPVNGGTIPVTANMPHPYWGACTVCHKVTDAAGNPVGLNAVDPRSMLGLELVEADLTTTTKLNLPDKKGPIITKVLPGGVGEDLGMQNGDMFFKVDNRKVETIVELERALGAFATGDVVRLTLWRERREKVFRFSIPDIAAQAAMGVFNNTGPGMGQPAAAMTVAQVDPNTAVADPQPEDTMIAIAAVGKDVNAAVANDLGTSPYFMIVDLKRNTFKVVQNAGGTGQQVVQDLMDLGVEAVICGYIGQGAASSLTTLGVKMYPGVSGNVSGAINAYKQGTLKEANAGKAPELLAPGTPDTGRRRTL